MYVIMIGIYRYIQVYDVDACPAIGVFTVLPGEGLTGDTFT